MEMTEELLYEIDEGTYQEAFNIVRKFEGAFASTVNKCPPTYLIG